MKPACWMLLGLMCFLATATRAADTFQFHRAQGTEIVNARGEPIFYRGISFGNRVWQNDRIPVKHHGPEDFVRVKEMGMNLVRFYLNYKTFEDDSRPYAYLDDGWKWLDDNIAWARQQGIYLILNMHIPQGGFQSHGKGTDLWQKPELQNRLIALWSAIAERYRDEAVIFGYDLVNEPGVPKSKKQWQQLAQKLVDAIRKVDAKHPIMVERVNSINRRWVNDSDMNFVKVKGENIIYTFHSYDPYFYTHQRIFWDDAMKDREGGRWPDPKKKYTRAYLEETIDRYLAWGKAENVPLYFGEWGVYKATYENGRGGLDYLSDMLSVLEERKLTNTFHVYHEESFGLYLGDDVLDPNNVNRALQQLFVLRYVKNRP